MIKKKINQTTKGFHRGSWSDAVAVLSQQGQCFVIATLLGSAGSTPRSAGTKMVITDSDIYDTVGGGHLEYKMIEKAREFLLTGDGSQNIEHFSLGASLGQCCGGSVSVLFETIVNEKLNVDVYGAGHVSHALMTILADLPVRVRWLDSRAELFPENLPANVAPIIDEFVVDQVKAAKPNTAAIIMTHNHQLDFSLCEALIKRGDCASIGVIGSETKAKRFRMRLEHKGLSQSDIQKMKCPVGLEEVAGKLPMEVAVSIAGEIIALYQSSTMNKPVRDGLQWVQLKSELTQTEIKGTEKV